MKILGKCIRNDSLNENFDSCLRDTFRKVKEQLNLLLDAVDKRVILFYLFIYFIYLLFYLLFYLF